MKKVIVFAIVGTTLTLLDQLFVFFFNSGILPPLKENMFVVYGAFSYLSRLVFHVSILAFFVALFASWSSFKSHNALRRMVSNMPNEDGNITSDGALSAETRGQSDSKSSFCTKCGSPLNEAELFCTKCGTRVPV